MIFLNIGLASSRYLHAPVMEGASSGNICERSMNIRQAGSHVAPGRAPCRTWDKLTGLRPAESAADPAIQQVHYEAVTMTVPRMFCECKVQAYGNSPGVSNAI
jgi:hypothetical protein